MAEHWRRQCSVTSRRTGERCKSWAIVGGSVCWHHGGRLPPVKEKAARELATREAYQRAGELTRDPARIAGIAAEALLRRAEETNDPADYDRASIAAKRAGEVAAALGQGTGAYDGAVTIDDEVREMVDKLAEASRREGFEAGLAEGRRVSS